MRTDTEEIVHKIQTGQQLDEREIDKVIKILMLTSQALYETSGAMFITGYAGDNDSPDRLPEYVFICPSYGADVQCTGTYRKQKKKET